MRISRLSHGDIVGGHPQHLLSHALSRPYLQVSISTVGIYYALYTFLCLLGSLENFLYGFVVPILPYILEIRNHVDPTDTQRLTYQILTLYGATAVVAGIVIGQLADKLKSRKLPLVLGLLFALLGTAVFATSTKCKDIGQRNE